MTETDTTAEAAPRTATEMRADTRASNRTLALVLVGVALVFLAGAVGVAVLVAYGHV
ncbi:hypothetical protein [Limimaricola sp.]|uniref:hypothetical protein n=1 Tax=Limimaricola sp. TaxID=2211665 RepID=UPI0025C329E0|nr:hypothetical protein [Limimaricola sp.]